jgi:hypothetical protein
VQETGKTSELRNLYVSPNVVTVIKSVTMRRAGHVACMEEIRNACNILVGKPEEKRLLRRHGRRRKGNITMDLREIWLEGLYWIHLVQDRDKWRAVVNTVLKFWVP